MDHDEIIGLLGAYSLDAIDIRERRVVAAHLQSCTMCRSEVDRFHEAVSNLGTEAVDPPAIWPRIVQEISPPVGRSGHYRTGRRCGRIRPRSGRHTTD